MAGLRKTIGYSGVTTTPNDWLCGDGELAVCQNLLNEDGGIRLRGEDSVVLSVPEGYACVYIHKGALYENYICVGGGRLCVIGSEAEAEYMGEYRGCASVGNVLILLTDEEMHYYLWKDGSYVDLGNGLPELDIEFTSNGYFNGRGEVVQAAVIDESSVGGYDAWINDAGHEERIGKKRPYRIEFDSLSFSINGWMATLPSSNDEVGYVKTDASETGGYDFPELLTNRCFNVLNKTLSDVRGQGLFVMPKLVRAAWRLYDGSYAKLSTPVLMYNMGTMHPLALGGERGDADLRNICSKLIPYTIDYKLSLPEGFSERWGDIIKGVTLFAGSDILDYDGSGQITELRRTSYSYSEVVEEEVEENGEVVVVERTEGYTYYSANLPRPSEASMIEKIADGGPFYKISDTDIKDLTDGYVMLVVSRVSNVSGSRFVDIEGHDVRLVFEQFGSQGGTEITIRIREGGSLDTIYDEILSKTTGLVDVSVHKMWMPNKRIGNSLVPYELGVAFVATKGCVRLGRIIVDDILGGQYETVDVFGWNCGGLPIASDKTPLKDLEVQESVNDDWRHHEKIVPCALSAYNDRLNMVGLSVRHEGYKLTANNVGVDFTSAVRGESASGYKVNEIYYYIKTEGGDVCVTSQSLGGKKMDLHYLYYPDARCYRAVALCSLNAFGAGIYDLPMKPSNTLNGAVFVAGMPHNGLRSNVNNDLLFAFVDRGIVNKYKRNAGIFPVELNKNMGVERLGNVVLTSFAGNPFNWAAKGEAIVGEGNVLSLVANTTALSDGQFGSHPLYAFTDSEGVWAMSISGDGQLVAVQPVSRDILSDQRSIVQTDRSVLFASDRGIMELSGASSACISERLDEGVSVVGSLPRFDALLRALFGDDAEAVSSCLADVGFREYCRGCRIVYDYALRRVVVFNEAYVYAYVYSLKTKSWSTMVCDYKDVLNSYPMALVTTRGGNVVRLSQGVSVQGSVASSPYMHGGGESGRSVGGSKGFLVTRPIKVDNPETLKTVYKVCQRGRFRKGGVRQVLYGSMDLETWHVVGSSSSENIVGMGGSPYRYFVVAMGIDLREGDVLEAMTIEYKDKWVNRIR